jgi:hypothetical protein
MLDRGICWVLIVGCRSLLSLPGCRVSVVEYMLSVDCRVSLLLIAVVSWLSDVGCRVHADCWWSGVAVSDCWRFLVVGVSVVKCMVTVDCRVSLSVIDVVSWLSAVGFQVHAVCWLSGVAVGDRCRFLVVGVSVVVCMMTADRQVSLFVTTVVSWLSDVGCRVHAYCWLSGVAVGDFCRFLVVGCRLSSAC